MQNWKLNDFNASLVAKNHKVKANLSGAVTTLFTPAISSGVISTSIKFSTYLKFT